MEFHVDVCMLVCIVDGGCGDEEVYAAFAEILDVVVGAGPVEGAVSCGVCAIVFVFCLIALAALRMWGTCLCF